MYSVLVCVDTRALYGSVDSTVQENVSMHIVNVMKVGENLKFQLQSIGIACPTSSIQTVQ